MELPYRFPDHLQEAAERAREFQALSSDERWGQIEEIARTALFLVEQSPNRAMTNRLFHAREAEWQQIQRELLNRYGS